MKKLLIALVFLMMCSGVAQAGGSSTDGVYLCNETVAGDTYTHYMTVNSRSDGLTILTFPILLISSPNTYGYALGLLSGNTFKGTSFPSGYSVSATVSGEAGAYSISGMGTAVIRGSAYPSILVCNQVF